MRRTVSIIVPVYNNAGTLRTTAEQIRDLFRKKISRHAFEIIFIDDGSSDGSWAELNALADEYPEVKLISFTRNFGQNPAVTAGFHHARGDCVITISADLQDPVALMEPMVAKWDEGFRIVAGVRSGREESFLRVLSTKVYYWLLRLSVPRYPANGFDYYLMDRSVADIVASYSHRNSFLLYDIIDTGFELFAIPYVRQARKVGRSGYTFSKTIKALYDNLINASYVPIRLMSFLGFLTALSGFLYAGTIAYSRLVRGAFPPYYAPVVILILVLSGMIMMMLGVIGEYLWRTFDHVKARPDYVIRESKLDRVRKTGTLRKVK